VATLPFTAVKKGTITLAAPGLVTGGFIRVFHADGTSTFVPITFPTTTVNVIAGDLVVQRFAGAGWGTLATITAQT
jgi:hypothetical protein